MRLCVPLSVVPDRGADAAIDAATPDAGIEAGDPCVGPAACYRCPPTNDTQFQNGCTNALCTPFDNKLRIKPVQPEGGLAPLPQ